MDAAVMEFCTNSITREMVSGKKVLEIGSRNINGVISDLIRDFKPSEYLGVDIIEDENVNLILDATDLDKHFPPETFDFIINTELMEHVVDWKKVVSNQKQLVKTGGHILITTRSKGFGYHGCPHDYWRYEWGDMRQIFADMKIVHLMRDWDMPGICILVQKPVNFVEKSLDDYELYSIVKWKKLRSITEADVTPWDIKRNVTYFAWRVKLANMVPSSWKKFVKSVLYKTGDPR